MVDLWQCTYSHMDKGPYNGITCGISAESKNICLLLPDTIFLSLASNFNLDVVTGMSLNGFTYAICTIKGSWLLSNCAVL